jgi:hypothetical protein
MIPENIREDIRALLWAAADDIGWTTMSDSDRSKYYENWTRSPTIGVRLSHFMDPRKVRVYIKDSLLKAYERKRLSLSEHDVWNMLGLATTELSIKQLFIKPHGRLLSDGRVICWGKSRDWKLILLGTYERGKRIAGATPYAVVLLESGKTAAEADRNIVRDVAHRLAIARIDWIGA